MRAMYVTAILVAASLVPATAQTPAPSAGASPASAASPGTPAASPGISSSPGPGSTPVDLARQRLDTMLRTGHADAGWFSASFLAQIPIDKVDAIVPLLKANLGEYRGIDGTQGQYIGHFAKGTDVISAHLDADNKIDLLLFKPPRF